MSEDITQAIYGENINVTKSKWKNKSVCHDCSYIFNELQCSLTCPECGNSYTTQQSIRYVYKPKWIIFKTCIRVEVKDWNGVNTLVDYE